MNDKSSPGSIQSFHLNNTCAVDENENNVAREQSKNVTDTKHYNTALQQTGRKISPTLTLSSSKPQLTAED